MRLCRLPILPFSMRNQRRTRGLLVDHFHPVQLATMASFAATATPTGPSTSAWLTQLVPVHAVRAGRFTMDCDRLPGRYRPPWQRDWGVDLE
jgi:hypothetical protein